MAIEAQLTLRSIFLAFRALFEAPKRAQVAELSSGAPGGRCGGLRLLRSAAASCAHAGHREDVGVWLCATPLGIIKDMSYYI